MSVARFFTHSDLFMGYWQFQVKESNREKTTFTTPHGHFQFCNGLTNAPATFQRAMNTILNGLLWTDCLVYLDDMVIFASSVEEHYKRLDKVLTLLKEAGLKIKPEKCEILPVEMKLLCHVV